MAASLVAALVSSVISNQPSCEKKVFVATMKLTMHPFLSNIFHFENRFYS